MTKQFNVKESVKYSPPDLLDLMGQMTKAESKFFLCIKNNMSYKTNRACLSHLTFSPSQQNKNAIYLKKFTQMDLVKRVKVGQLKNLNGETILTRKHTYMINPDFIHPNNSVFLEIQENWDSLL